MEKNEGKKKIFDGEAIKCQSFIERLNKCTTDEEIKAYVDSIVEAFPQSDVKELGTKAMFSKGAYSNNGQYNGFIGENIKLSNSTLGYSYHIYDRDYLYNFASKVKDMNLKEGKEVIPYVLEYLNEYFGYPKDNVDRREDVLYDYSLKHAEEFYKRQGKSLEKGFENYSEQMQMEGSFPISALKGTHSAQCIERAAIAQNILKMCGYDSSIIYGDIQKNGRVNGHCWNSISDKDGNVMLVDYSDVVLAYNDGTYSYMKPYIYTISKEDYERNGGTISLPDYRIDNKKRISNQSVRKYAAGKSLTKEEPNLEEQEQ